MGNKKILEINDLYVTYSSGKNKVRAVNGLNLMIDEGECLGLVGETGAGKTTTALSIMQLLPNRTATIEKGEILFNGKDLLKARQGELRTIRGSKIAMIFQDPMTSLNPIMTIGTQIYEGLELHNDDNLPKEKLEERAIEMLEKVGIPKTRYNEFPHQFSGGMKQRVVIAMALACNPALLIADEPTTALDVTIQAQVLDMISKLREDMNMTMILITHDLGIVAEKCDNVATMYAGEVIEYGKVEDIFEGEEHHPYTTGLFEAIPNLNSTERRLKSIKGLMPDPTDLPKGCNFSPRCPYCTKECTESSPNDVWLSDTHYIKCHKYSKNDKEEI